MASFGYGYGNVTDRGFVAFGEELEQGAWGEVAIGKLLDKARGNAAALLDAPQPVVWKVRLRIAIDGVVAALGAASLVDLDGAWDACQRRLFHRIGAGVDDKDKAIRAASDRLRAGLLLGNGTGQTQLDYDQEVDFGLQQLALTKAGGPLAADAKKLGIGDVLGDIDAATAALAKGIGRSGGAKRKAPSRALREAMTACVAAFNGVHDALVWLVEGTAPGEGRDRLSALLAPLDALLERHPRGAAPVADEAPAGPADPPKPA
jgi:hypothetical protein